MDGQAVTPPTWHQIELGGRGQTDVQPTNRGLDQVRRAAFEGQQRDRKRAQKVVGKRLINHSEERILAAVRVGIVKIDAIVEPGDHRALGRGIRHALLDDQRLERVKIAKH